MIFGTQKSDVNGVIDFSFGHLIPILLLYYFVKIKSRSLAIYNNDFILGSACVGSEMIN